MTIQDEIKQSVPFESVQQEAVVGLLRTASIVRFHLEQISQREGITLQQYNVLRILRGASEPMNTYEVGARLIEHNPGISRLMDRLDKKGYIERCRAADDRRCVLCSVTAAGLKVLSRLDAPLASAGEELFRSTSSKDIGVLIRVLESIRQSA